MSSCSISSSCQCVPSCFLCQKDFKHSVYLNNQILYDLLKFKAENLPHGKILYWQILNSAWYEDLLQIQFTSWLQFEFALRSTENIVFFTFDRQLSQLKRQVARVYPCRRAQDVRQGISSPRAPWGGKVQHWLYFRHLRTPVQQKECTILHFCLPLKEECYLVSLK